MKKEFLMYTVVSAVAWFVDVGCLYFAVLYLAMPGYLAAAIAYAVGLVVHYVLSVRYVFIYRRMADEGRIEILVYALTGIAGIALSAGIVHIGGLLGQRLIVSKLIATLVTFIVIFIIRKISLFTRDDRDTGRRL